MDRIISKEWFDYSNIALDDIEKTKDILRISIAYIDKNHKEWAEKRDARSNLFVGIKKVLQSTQLSYLNIRYCLIDKNYWKKFIKQFKEDEINQHIKEYNVMILTGWLYGISSIVEESFRLILRKIKPDACNDSKDAFQNIYSCLLKELALQESTHLFDIFRLVRNCIHTNGVFYPINQKDVHLKFREFNCDFVVGKQLNFVNFHFSCLLTQDISKVLHSMVSDEKIEDLDLIPRM